MYQLASSSTAAVFRVISVLASDNSTPTGVVLMFPNLIVSTMRGGSTQKGNVFVINIYNQVEVQLADFSTAKGSGLATGLLYASDGKCQKDFCCCWCC